LVGELFEVRTQVDHDLTTFSRVDRRLGLIKNLGRHSEGVDDGRDRCRWPNFNDGDDELDWAHRDR
jgi:hypothetical protein